MARAASSRSRNLNRRREGGALETPGVGRTISAAAPARAPPRPHALRAAQSDGPGGGTAALTRLWRGRPAGERTAVGGTPGPGRVSARPLAFPGGGAGARHPASSPPGVGGAAGAPGAGPGAGLPASLRPSPERARRGGRTHTAAVSARRIRRRKGPRRPECAHREDTPGGAARSGAGRPRPRRSPSHARTGPAQPRRGERWPGEEGAGDARVTAPPWRSPRRQRRPRRRRRS